MTTPFTFSRRTNWELTSNELNDEVERLHAANIDIIDLTESNPTRAGFSYPQEMLNVLADPANMQYVPDSKGMPRARQEVARYYKSAGQEADVNSIVLTSSTSEAYAFLLRLLVNPGEKVLIAKPSYPLFQYLIELADAEYDFYPLLFDGVWKIDFDAMEEAITPLTRVVILVNPNNPTGSYISSEELKRLNAICLKHKIAIISDEVFFDYRLDPAAKIGVSLMNNNEVLTFVLSGLSKSLGLPQMKLSWIVASGPQADVKEALNRLEIIADTFLSVNTPVQNALGSWFASKNKIQSMILERVRRNYEMIQACAGREGIKCLPSHGGWYAVLSIPSIDSEEEWILKLLREEHVLVHPGYFFDFDCEGYIVLSLLPAQDRMKAGLDKMLKFLERK